MGQLKVKRIPEWANRRFSYTLVVDGKEITTIANGEEKLLTVTAGATLQAKLMWCGSEKVIVPATAQEIAVHVATNKGLSLVFPIVALILFAAFGVASLMGIGADATWAFTLLIIGVMGYAVCLLTIWRRKFLTIEWVNG